MPIGDTIPDRHETLETGVDVSGALQRRPVGLQQVNTDGVPVGPPPPRRPARPAEARGDDYRLVVTDGVITSGT